MNTAARCGTAAAAAATVPQLASWLQPQGIMLLSAAVRAAAVVISFQKQLPWHFAAANARQGILILSAAACDLAAVISMYAAAVGLRSCQRTSAAASPVDSAHSLLGVPSTPWVSFKHVHCSCQCMSTAGQQHLLTVRVHALHLASPARPGSAANTRIADLHTPLSDPLHLHLPCTMHFDAPCACWRIATLL